MKDSKEKEHRISNLKDMIDNVKDENEGFNNEEFEEDEELIDYLQKNPDLDDLEIDDEYIYRPGDEREYDVDLDENPIDENFIIKTPKEDLANESDEIDDIVGDINGNIDSIFNAKIGRTPVFAFVSAILGLILILFSVFIFQSRSDRVIDNVVSGETNFISVIVLAIGLLFLIYGIYKMFNIRNPIKGLTESIDSIDNADNESKTVVKEDIPKAQKEDNDAYKIGEFGIDELKQKLKKSKTPEKEPITEEDLDNIPPAREKEESKKGLTAEEIENIEYEQVKLDNETIDDIFAEVEDIDEMPIISIDSEDKEEQ